jgi:hypothetical protein
MHRRGLLVLPVVVAVCGVVPATAGTLRPEEAKRFVAGKVFSYTCFEGTRGAGRINEDGSVAGTIQVRGWAAPRHVTLPAGTVRVSSSSICASVRGIAFKPCFNVDQTSNVSFRGSVSGFGFAYCDFVRRNPRREITSPTALPRTIRASLRPTQAYQPEPIAPAAEIKAEPIPPAANSEPIQAAEAAKKD